MKKVVIIFLFFILICRTNAKERTELFNIKCIDGDTIKASINGNVETIRFLAINTPETKYSTKDKDEPYAKEASDFTCNKLNNAKKIELEYDLKSDKADKYGRVLGWIFVDDILLQKEIISRGLAKVEYVYDDYEYINELKEEEKIAKGNKLGIWSDEKYNNDSLIDKIVDFIVDTIKDLIEKICNFIKKLLKDNN